MNNTLKYLENVVTLEFDDTKCTGCGRCTEVCPHGVFALNNGKVKVTDRDACMECGACSRNCAFGALAVTAGVGCAAGIIRGALGIKGTDCCCSNTADCC
jgi:NAD-dependent dihydropyrimidine dehydrogenase PreA subunit